MPSHAFGAFVEIAEPSKKICDPAAVHQKAQAPTAIELDALTWGTKYSGPQTPCDGVETPSAAVVANDLEVSRPASPRVEADLIQSWSYPHMNRWRVLCACLIYFGNGMSDSAPGALIPYMESKYNIGYAIVSLIFVTNALGFIAAAFFTEPLLARVGRAKSLMLGEVLIILGNIMIVCTPPFGVVVVSFLFLGFGCAIGLALNNVFCSNLANSTVILGAAHGSYGIGGTAGPILATALASHGIVWSRFYLVTLGIRVACFVFAFWSFWGYENEAPVQLLATAERSSSSHQEASEATGTSKRQVLKQALKNWVTIVGALFIFAYQGAEVSISGWVISFLIHNRHGNPAQLGYVTAGFWAGITLGRFILTHVAHRIGEKIFVTGLILGAIIFQLLIWLVPNTIGDAVAVAIIGFLLGPIYPCTQTILSRLLPRKIQTVSVGFIGSAGSSGGALAPFMTGLLSQAVGTFVLHPVCVGLYVAMLGCWATLPKAVKRRD